MRAVILIILASLVTIAGCHSTTKPTDQNAIVKDNKSRPATNRSNIDWDSIKCSDLNEKSVLLAIGYNTLDNADEDSSINVFNLSELDTTGYFTTEDYFTNKHNKSKIVLMQGSAGMSAGDANNLLLLFDCGTHAKLIWAGQVAPFTPQDILDVNNDGIKEIVIRTNSMWQDVVNENFSVFNFQGNHRYFLFERQSTEVPYDNQVSGDAHAAVGDTLKEWYDCTLINTPGKGYQVKQIKTINIYEGGKNDDEVDRLLKVSVDTSYTNLLDIH